MKRKLIISALLVLILYGVAWAIAFKKTQQHANTLYTDGGQTLTADLTLNDNIKLTLGTGGDADVWYDGTNLTLDPVVVGTGDILLAPNGGDVAIGTSTPNTVAGNAWTDVDFHVKGASGGGTMALTGATQSFLLLSDEDAAANLKVWALASVNGEFRIDDWNDNESLKGTRVLVDASGLMGIGPTAPAERLEIEDGNATTAIQISNTAADGDSILAFALSGVKTVTMGVDDGDSDKFKIGSTAIGTNTTVDVDVLNRAVGLGTAAAPSSTNTVHIRSGVNPALRVENSGFNNDIQQWYLTGNEVAALEGQTSLTVFTLTARDLTNNVPGGSVQVGRNTSAGTEGPAAPTIKLEEADGTDQFYWTDAAGNLRINTAAPTGSSGTPTVSDTAGTVVGTQTSWWRLKDNIQPFTDYKSVLATVIETPLYSFDMNGRHYGVGLVIHDKDIGSWYSWNDDLDKKQVPTLNDRQIIGYLVGAIKELNNKIEKLEGRKDAYYQ